MWSKTHCRISDLERGVGTWQVLPNVSHLGATCRMSAYLCALYSIFKLLCKHMDFYVLNIFLSVDFFFFSLKRIYFQRKLCITTRSGESAPLASTCRGGKINAMITVIAKHPGWTLWAAQALGHRPALSLKEISKGQKQWKTHKCPTFPLIS